MDKELEQKYAPRLNKRHPRVRSFTQEAEWARSLDWKTNDYDFYRLTYALLNRLDSDLRETYGLRIDQLADSGEIRDLFRTCRTWYQQEPTFQNRGIYVFLHINLKLWLAGKASAALEKRRETAERLIGETTPSNA